MNSNPDKITFEYDFVSDRKSISNKDRRNVSTILAVEATLTIKINDELYFETELAILEFYKSLWRWKESITIDSIPEFHYYTVEYADYEDGAILSFIPFANKASVKSIWAEQDISTIFDLHDIVQEFILLEANLKRDIEEYFEIDLDSFMKYIPFQKSSH